MEFKEFVKEIIGKSGDLIVVIKGKEKRIKGMARFTSENLYPDEYIKIVFDDHSHMVVSLPDEVLFYADRVVGLVEEVKDDEIGVSGELMYGNKSFELDNSDDYQFCLQVYKGKAGTDIEGEVKFSDYLFEETGKTEMLSLGWTVCDGKRADVWVEKIGIDEVEVVE